MCRVQEWGRHYGVFPQSSPCVIREEDPTAPKSSPNIQASGHLHFDKLSYCIVEMVISQEGEVEHLESKGLEPGAGAAPWLTFVVEASPD